jgi:hypothetical protein
MEGMTNHLQVNYQWNITYKPMEDMWVTYRAIIINKSLSVYTSYATQYDAKHMLIKHQ